MRALLVMGISACASRGRIAFDPSADASARDADAAGAQITEIQSATNESTAASNSFVFAQPVQEHAAVVVCFTFPTGSTLIGIDDALGNTYSTIAGPVTANGFVHYIALATGSPAGSDVVTVTLSQAVAGGWESIGIEYAGLVLVDALDGDAYDSGTGTAMTSGAVSTSSAHELLLAYAHSTRPAAGSGYTARETTIESLVEDRVVFTRGSYAAAGTTTEGIWTLILVALLGT